MGSSKNKEKSSALATVFIPLKKKKKRNGGFMTPGEDARNGKRHAPLSVSQGVNMTFVHREANLKRGDMLSLDPCCPGKKGNLERETPKITLERRFWGRDTSGGLAGSRRKEVVPNRS